MNKNFFIVCFVALLVLVGVFIVYDRYQESLLSFGMKGDTEQIDKGENGVEKTDRKKYRTACTMDAKLCPDGSGVGRVGPRCVFDACPFNAVDMSDWVTFNDSSLFKLEYPSSWAVRQSPILSQDPSGKGHGESYLFTGPEGSLMLFEVEREEMDCHRGLTYLESKNKRLIACERVQDDGTVTYTEVTVALPGESKSNLPFYGEIIVNPQAEDNTDIVMTILSTVDFLD